MTQIVAETMGMPMEDVLFKLGDTDLPLAPIQGGSWTASTVGSAVKAVCDDLKKTLFKIAQKMPGSPLAKAKWEQVLFADGAIKLKTDPSVGVSFINIVGQNGGRAITETSTSIPNILKHKRYSRHCYAGVFVEGGAG